MKIGRLTLLIILVLSTSWGWSQNSAGISRGDFYFETKLIVIPNNEYIVDVNFKFTAFTSSFNSSSFPYNAIITVGEDRYILTKDEHAPESKNQSNLISINSSESELLFNSGDYEGEVIIYLLNSDSYFKTDVRHRKDSDSDQCEEPDAVDQSEWRAGLPSPNYSRSFTDVEHIIIHHSAGSNNSTNFTQVVRDIYLYHTEVNGWSDIGYNYLIDKEGIIYKGRDPDLGEQDNVRGAHFCGKNTGTMGVCLLGNFEEANIDPSPEAIKSLVKLTSWKLIKESLDPFSTSIHQGQVLGVVVGHRDGCSTLCPGTNTYVQLESFRALISETILGCEQMEVAPLILTSDIYPNPARVGELVSVELNEEQTIKSIYIIDPSGKIVAKPKISQSGNIAFLLTFFYAPGTYFLEIITQSNQVKHSRIVLY